MIAPEHPTPDQILAMIRFHETGALHYSEHRQAGLEEWSKAMAEEWRDRLPVPAAQPEPARDGKALALPRGDR